MLRLNDKLIKPELVIIAFCSLLLCWDYFLAVPEDTEPMVAFEATLDLPAVAVVARVVSTGSQLELEQHGPQAMELASREHIAQHLALTLALALASIAVAV